MVIRLIVVGKNKKGAITELVADYTKLLTPFTEVETTVIPSVPLSGSNNIEVVKRLESEQLLKALVKSRTAAAKPTYVVLLDREGKLQNTETFCKLLAEKAEVSEIVFIVGGVYGVSEMLLSAVDHSLSLSPLTFTHQMSRIILLEQIYRSFCIIKNKKYHY